VQVGAGDRIGLIRFGSRVDVYLPDGAQPLIGFGAKATAGETILADMRSVDTGRSYKVG
jgi:phosphatidylserine decarboxylase